MSKRKRKTVLGNTAKRNRSTTNYTRNYPKSYMKKNTKTSATTQVLWGISLAVLGVSGVFFGIAGIVGWMMPDVLMRIIGIVDVVALPMLVATTIIKLKNAEK